MNAVDNLKSRALEAKLELTWEKSTTQHMKFYYLKGFILCKTLPDSKNQTMSFGFSTDCIILAVKINQDTCMLIKLFRPKPNFGYFESTKFCH